ncbi:MAG: arginine--tRNA ligase [Candidatus Omnitrophota bacterium]|jgi:arginyl-tRNA synthetase
MKSKIQQFVDETIEDYLRAGGLNGGDDFSYDLAASKEGGRGDFACNVAFKLSKMIRRSPREVAQTLVEQMEERCRRDPGTGIARIEIAGAGFINFTLARKSYGEILKEVFARGEHYGVSDFGKGRKVLLEFVSANPTGPLTIAHGRQAAVGDALANILGASGHAVEREYYLNDAGRQMKLLGQSLWVRYRNLLGEEVPLPEDAYQGEYLIAIAQKLKTEKQDALMKCPADEAVRFCSQFAGEDIMAGIREDLALLGVRMDHYFSEGTLFSGGQVEATLALLSQKGFLYEKEGALWFRSTDFGDDKDRVVRKSTGETTYLAPDIAYHRYKFDRGFQWLINFLGPDHHGYVTRLKAACRALGHRAEDIDVRIVQLTTLYRKGEPVRMSTRAGQFVTLRELVEEVGADAARFFFIMRKVESHLDFDLELAKQKSQDNPVYYLQYAYARIASLIRFAQRPVRQDAELDRLVAEEETALIRMISEFPHALVSASELMEPYRLADYLRDLATCFHKFYSLHRIVTEDQPLTDARLLLAEAVKITMENGLRLLGISRPETM